MAQLSIPGQGSYLGLCTILSNEIALCYLRRGLASAWEVPFGRCRIRPCATSQITKDASRPAKCEVRSVCVHRPAGTIPRASPHRAAGLVVGCLFRPRHVTRPANRYIYSQLLWLLCPLAIADRHELSSAPLLAGAFHAGR